MHFQPISRVISFLEGFLTVGGILTVFMFICLLIDSDQKEQAKAKELEMAALKTLNAHRPTAIRVDEYTILVTIEGHVYMFKADRTGKYTTQLELQQIKED